MLADESGAAWIDADAFVIRPPPGLGPEPTEARIAAGDELVVSGPARIENADSEAQAHTATSYREGGRVLRFAGDAEHPLVLLRVSPAAS